MSTEAMAALISAVIAILGLISSYIIARQQRVHEHELRQAEQRANEQRMRVELAAKHQEWLAELRSEEQRWQESFRAELRRYLTQESTLETVRARMRLYSEVWRALRITSQHEWRRLTDPKPAVQNLAEQLTIFAYSDVGMVMSDRSRRLLTNLRASCGKLLRDEIDGSVLINNAHLLKHSMRSDLGIITEEYESDLDRIAQKLGRVDEWIGQNDSANKSVKID